jgi:hypothetical protein
MAFRRTYALCGSPVGAARARAHLDKYERVAVASDKVNLAESAPPVTNHDL